MKKKFNNSPHLSIENKEDFEQMLTICKALGDRKRLTVIKELQKEPFKIGLTELARKLDLPITTLVHHVEILEKAELINIIYKNDDKKNTRVISRKMKDIHMDLYHPVVQLASKQLCETQEVRVGHYVSFEGDQLKFATNARVHVLSDGYFFSPHKFDAELLFSSYGIVEYYFDNSITRVGTIEKMMFHLEICSEFPFYDMNHKSDITFWINGVEIATHTCDGDYGDRRGKLNPEWWLDINTQYGKMVTVAIDETGVRINGVIVNDKINISHLKLNEGNKISFKLGNKKACKNPGGFNLFGKGFGDYPQDIVLQLYYKTTEK